MESDRIINTKSKLELLQEWSLFSLFIAIPFFRFGTDVLQIKGLDIKEFFFILTCFLLIANLLIDKNIRTIFNALRHKTSIFFILFLSISFLSLINARYFQTFTINELKNRIIMAATFILVVAIVKDRQTIKRLIVALLIGSIFTTFVGLYEMKTGKAVIKETQRHTIAAENIQEGLQETPYYGSHRVQGLYSVSGFHAFSMYTFFGLAIPFLFFTKSKLLRYIIGFLLLCYFVNIIASGSRSGWLAFFFLFVMFSLLIPYQHKLALFMISFICAISLFILLAITSDVPTVERFQTKSIEEVKSWRLTTFTQAFEMIKDKPILGHGTGNYLSEYHNYLRSYPTLSRYYFGPIHNSFLQIWVENGTIGFLLFACFLVSIFISLLTIYFSTEEKELKIVTLSLLLPFCGFLVQACFTVLINQMLLPAILALAVSLIVITNNKHMALYEEK